MTILQKDKAVFREKNYVSCLLKANRVFVNEPLFHSIPKNVAK